MAPNVTFTNYSGTGQRNSDLYHYSQAVRIGQVIKVSGQGGWNECGELTKGDTKTQVQYAFDNLDKAIKEAGGKGLTDVYSVRSWHVNMEESFPFVVEQLKKTMPDHRPLFTCVGVTTLALPEMEIEIDVEAYVESK
ncbi:Endoribonuclease L-PSP/chorismate mutase-like protein [Xylogone sp. PMI_703]|nr:Endoribonuclease L-PSP/chorismate mutase-like protein [Xylogone sp. PMI_703]